MRSRASSRRKRDCARRGTATASVALYCMMAHRVGGRMVARRGIFLALVMFATIVFGAPIPRARAGGPSAPGLEKAAFAGGCFWCMQPAFDHIPGVVSTVVGYTGGEKQNPTY